LLVIGYFTQFASNTYLVQLYVITQKCQNFAVGHERVGASRRQSGCLHPL